MINKKASMEIMIMKKKTWDNKKILPKKKMRQTKKKMRKTKKKMRQINKKNIKNKKIWKDIKSCLQKSHIPSVMVQKVCTE